MLSNTFLQVLIGCAPFLLLFLGLSIFSKKHRVRNICLTVLIAAIAGSGALINIGDVGAVSAEAPMADQLRFAYALMDEGCYDLADDVIRESRATGAYSDESTLALARVSSLQGKTQAAQSLYGKLEKSDERDAALSLAEGDSDQIAALNSLIADEIDEYLSDNKAENYDRAAKAAAFAHTQYEGFLSGDAFDKEEVESECRKIIKLSREQPELLRIAPLRIARLKLQLMLEDYSGIAECVDDYSDYNELLIVSELYMNGYIKAKDFSEEYRKGDMENYKVVSDTLQKVYSEYYSDRSREERKEAKAQISALKALMKNPSLIKVQNSLLEYAESEFAYDKSKVYLQLAKTENYMDNTIKSNEYLDRSLNTVGDCADEEYTAPMYEIIGIIADKDDPERLKDVAVYTDKILSNTMTVQMRDELKAPAVTDDSDDDRDDDDETAPTQSEKMDFSAQMNTYVSQKRMAVNITGVDATDTDAIKANINISGDLDYSISELRDMLEVSDCELNIDEFSLEKVEYKSSNILMCCDVSGSMSWQSIEDLKAALTDFVNTTDEIESVALVTFSNGIEDVCTFGTENTELLETIADINNGGGTDIYSAVCESISHFKADIDSVNTIILMSDGDDGLPGSETLNENVVKPCAEKGITIYSIGLTQDVNSNLLTTYASITGGSYVYASDSSQISAFFESLRSQTLNSYRLTFAAQDTLQNTRNLRVSVGGESYTYDEHWYTLDGSPVDESLIGENVVFLDNKAIYGFGEKLIFKSERSRTLVLHGSGFGEDDRFTVGLEGCIDYNNLAWDYISDSMMSVTIPAGIACDSYDVRVGLNGRKTTLRNGLTVVIQGSEKQTVFGDHVFTSYFKEVTDDGIRLSQYVTMNGWLHFNGDVLLEGDLDDSSITLVTTQGAYVHYDADAAQGAAAAYAGRDMTLALNGEFELYRSTTAERSETRIDQLILPEIVMLDDAYTAIYPDKLTLRSDELTLRMPYLRDVLSGSDLYHYYTDVNATISADDIELSAQYDDLSADERPRADNAASLGNIPVYINNRYTEFRLDSDGMYLGYVAALPFISDEGAFDLSIYGGWGDGEVRLDDMQLRSAYDVPLKGVPADVCISGFKLGLKQNTDKYVLVGGFGMNSKTLAELFPGIEKYLGDMAEESLVNCRKSELVLPLGEYYITAKADINMMKHIQLRNILMELGRSDHTNKLLGMDSDSVYGFRGITDALAGIHNDNCDIDIDGSIEAHITDSFIGITGDGELSFDADWWSITEKLSGQGSAVIGVQQTHDGDLVFVTKAQSGDNTFYIRWSDLGGEYYGSTQL